MNVSSSEQRFDTVVIGGGQSGLVGNTAHNSLPP